MVVKRGSFIDTSSGKPKRYFGILRQIVGAPGQLYVVLTLSRRAMDDEEEEEQKSDSNDQLTFIFTHLSVRKFLRDKDKEFRIVDIEDSYEIRINYMVKNPATYTNTMEVSQPCIKRPALSFRSK